MTDPRERDERERPLRDKPMSAKEREYWEEKCGKRLRVKNDN